MPLCAFALGSTLGDICHRVVRVGECVPLDLAHAADGGLFPRQPVVRYSPPHRPLGEAAARSGAGHLSREFELRGGPREVLRSEGHDERTVRGVESE